MVILNQLASNFLLLALFLSFSLGVSTKTQDDFVECLSHQIDGNLISQIIYSPYNSSYDTLLYSYTVAYPRLAPAAYANKPSFILTPLDESHIQTALHCSKIHDLQIRVRSGGHDYEGLSYICENPFVIIDLRNFKSISIDTTEKTAWIQAGATLGEVYFNIAAKSKTLAFTAGTSPSVGVGGHFSGGGYGMMSRKFGLSADNVIDAKIIDVKGRILDRESMGEDLFWAIRGGGGASFGIITSWKVKLLDIPEKMTVFNVTRTLEQNATQLVHKWQHIAHKVDDNLTLRVYLTTFGKSYLQVSFNALYLGGTKQLLHVMRESFPELGLLKQDCTEMSWIESVVYFSKYPRGVSPSNILLNPKLQIGFKGKSDVVQDVISTDDLERIWKRFNEENSVKVSFSPLGGKFNDYSESETPFPFRAGNLFMIEYELTSEDIVSSIRKLYRDMGRFVSKSPRGAYFNHKDLDLGVNDNGKYTSNEQASIWGVKYFKNNFKRLVKVKTKVDPTNFFWDQQSIPPLSNEELNGIMFMPKIAFSRNYF